MHHVRGRHPDGLHDMDASGMLQTQHQLLCAIIPAADAQGCADTTTDPVEGCGASLGFETHGPKCL